jgi:hypothetical protein
MTAIVPPALSDPPAAELELEAASEPPPPPQAASRAALARTARPVVKLLVRDMRSPV